MMKLEPKSAESPASFASSVIVSVAVSMAALMCGTKQSDESTVARGQRLYASVCALCHGTQGEGYRADDAPRLAGQEFLTRANDAFLERAILEGRPGTTMSAWSKARGGPLSDDDAAAIADFLRTWQTERSVPLGVAIIAGDPVKGQVVYGAECQGCHGIKGESGRYANIGNPVFLASTTDEFIRDAIVGGRSQTPMMAYGSRLSPEAIGDLVALVRSWQRPIDGPETLPPGPGSLEHVVLNEGGPEPPWDPAVGFIAVDTVEAFIESGGALVLADARPPSDYGGSHISGAISVPFFDVKSYLPEIPKDRFVVTYCSCPHAESGAAADVFRAQGYPRVAVLDEGFATWRSRGYPTRSGGKP